MPWKNGNPPLYHVWRSMIDRCYSTKNSQYHDYGGRGIKVCPRWKKSYQRWFVDMGERPEGTSIDRKDNDGDYTPENCKWSTRKEQQRNQRVTRRIEINGVVYVAAELAERAGFKTDIIMERFKRGLSFEEIISKERFRKTGFGNGAFVSAKKRREKTHCKNGHEFTTSNTRWEGNGKYTWRACRACHRERQRR